MQALRPVQTLVVKVGTSTLTGGTKRLSRPRMVDLIRQVAQLHHAGYRVVLVSSGAMAAGREKLNQPNLPNHLPTKQMLCAVGQGYLMEVYSTLFGLYDVQIGQVLLTHADLANRTRYLNARHTFSTLLEYRIVPIVNENDTVAVEEIKVGDNDNLSAQIAVLLGADLLVLLTDQAGLFDSDPRANPNAQLMTTVAEIDEHIYALAGGSVTGLGTGGMLTKLQAAQLATRSGTRTVIAKGDMPDVLLRLIDGEGIGTTFLPTVSYLESRKRWLLAERPQGTLYIDTGAVEVLSRQGASLLPVGVSQVSGIFERGAVVVVKDSQNREIAKGLVNYSNTELGQLCGRRSSEIVDVLGYTYGDEAIHRDQLVMIGN
ncbi:MAG: glutamate 5-kinase [Anaerolineales bacterium]|nr:glutamate 5-kinase [Anaerolineales bacterium]